MDSDCASDENRAGSWPLPVGRGLLEGLLRDGPLSFSISRLCAGFLASAFTLLSFCAGAAPVTLDFSTGTQGFVDSGAAGGTLTYSTNIGSGSLRLTNPAGWIWRARLDVNNGSTGTLGSVYAALQAAGAWGG